MATRGREVYNPTTKRFEGRNTSDYLSGRTKLPILFPIFDHIIYNPSQMYLMRHGYSVLAGASDKLMHRADETKAGPRQHVLEKGAHALGNLAETKSVAMIAGAGETVVVGLALGLSAFIVSTTLSGIFGGIPTAR